LGKQSSGATTSFWEGLLNGLEASRSDGWVTATMRLRNASIEDQRSLEKPIRHAVYRYTKNGPAMGHAVWGPQSRREGLIYLVRGQQFDKADVERDIQAVYKKIAAEGIADPPFVLIEPPKAGVVKRALVVKSEQEATSAANFVDK
jgi:hypothetical protein